MPATKTEQSIEQLADLATRFDVWSEKPFNGSIAQTDRYIEFAQELRAALGEALAKIDRITREHRPLPNSCSALFPDPLCSCNDDYPCATVRALKERKAHGHQD